MPPEPQIFDAARMVLNTGINLVEAGAGTGKTTAITMLALRLIAEQGIPIEAMLIVTFTKAATEELKARIRSRLTAARDLLAGEEPTGTPDQPLLDWAATAKGRPLLLDRLRLALCDIDRAGIFTIHAFCQRMLQEQALESEQLFDVELVADIEDLRTQVTDDFWRTRVYPLPAVPCQVLTGVFPTPEALRASVMRGNWAHIEPAAEDVAPALARLDAAHSRMAAWWRRSQEALYPLLQEGVATRKFQGAFSAGFERWWRELSGFFAGTALIPPTDLHLLSREGLLQVLNGSTLRGDKKKAEFVAGLPLPDAENAELVGAMADVVLSFRVALARTLQEEVERRLQTRGTVSFNDLILRLSRVLASERGAALRALLRQRYQAALIDEFQDTDTAQWRIFSDLFGGGTHHLYLIGDPKQAIYRFRGADIASYFAAKTSADRHLTLKRNYRSHPDLVEEVNRLFARPAPFGFPESVLGYHRIIPAKTVADGHLFRDGGEEAVMQYCRLPLPEAGGRWTAGAAADRIARFVLREVVGMLDPAHPLLACDGGKPRPVRPQDIAILVRSNRQAADYQRLFSASGIPAVIASRESVFATEACRELHLVLLAVVAPGDILRLKTAMTSSWFGLSGRDLQAIWQDDAGFGRWHSRFQGYFQLWREQGFLTMMSRLLAEERVLPILAAGAAAERHIANIHHLLELIQAEESAEGYGVGRTLQWLQTKMTDGRGGEDVELRLESDEEAVRIVTMHSAKGLEYPIVFCPYLWQRSGRLQSERLAVVCHDPDRGLVLDLGSAQFAKRRERAVAEELAEDLRLLYVAVTRAKLRCSIFWADVKPMGPVADSFSSALGYLLFPQGPVDNDVQAAVLQSLAERPSVVCAVVPDCEPDTTGLRRQWTAPVALAPLPPSSRSLQTDWQMSSYSAMAALSEYDGRDTPAEPAADSGPLPWPGLPSGADFGNVVHAVLETEPFAALAAGDAGEHIDRQCARFGVRAEREMLSNLLRAVVTTPLSASPGRDFTLADLAPERCAREMPFYFHPEKIATAEINAILAEEPAFTPLTAKVMRGYLTGFVDLFCEHRGRYYLLDYKTNNLGDFVGDYAADSLVRAMAAHNYGLQYWLYTLVLHRHLQNVVPGYAYERHFGGVLYLFVRGMLPAIPGSGVYAARPDPDLLGRLLACVGGDL